MIQFTIPGKPPTATAQQKGQNRRTGAYYKPPKLREAESYYMTVLEAHKPDTPLDGAVVLKVDFLFPRGKAHKDNEPKTTKPDTDNMVKLLKDCMTKKGFWHDDAQVAVELVRKWWSSEPGTLVEVAGFDEVERNG